MSHLGPLTSALVDGELDAAKAERARAHLVVCADCAAEYRTARGARAAVAGAQLTSAPDLTDRLLAMAPVPPPAPSYDPIRHPSPPVQATLPHPRSRRLLVVGSLGASVLLVALFALGSLPSVRPLPTLDVLAAFGPADAAVGGVGPDSLATSGLPVPAHLPPGTTVAWAQTTGDAAHLLLASPGGRILLIAERGLLTSQLSAASGYTWATDVRVISTAPLTLVWQDGDYVVELVSSAPADTVAAIVDAYPHDPAPTGIGDRIGRGWQALANFLTGG